MIYSADDKVIPEANNDNCKMPNKIGITDPALDDPKSKRSYTAISQRIDKDSQAIFILKDNLVASGINTLVYQANKKRIYL